MLSWPGGQGIRQGVYIPERRLINIIISQVHVEYEILDSQWGT